MIFKKWSSNMCGIAAIFTFLFTITPPYSNSFGYGVATLALFGLFVALKEEIGS